MRENLIHSWELHGKMLLLIQSHGVKLRKSRNLTQGWDNNNIVDFGLELEMNKESQFGKKGLFLFLRKEF